VPFSHFVLYDKYLFPKQGSSFWLLLLLGLALGLLLHILLILQGGLLGHLVGHVGPIYGRWPGQMAGEGYK